MYHAEQSMQDMVMDATNQDEKNKVALDPNLGIVSDLVDNSSEFSAEATSWEN